MSAYQMLIGGKWKSNGQSMPVVSPANEEVIATVPVASAEDVQSALDSAVQGTKGMGKAFGRGARSWSFGAWRNWWSATRIGWLSCCLRSKANLCMKRLGRLLLARAGSPYYAEFDRRIEGDILPSENRNEQIWIVPAPVGVVVGIIPWNYPSAVAIRKIAPALIAGNSIVLKPHEDTPLSALELAKLAEEAGVPPGVLNVVTGPGETVGRGSGEESDSAPHQLHGKHSHGQADHAECRRQCDHGFSRNGGQSALSS